MSTSGDRQISVLAKNYKVDSDITLLELWRYDPVRFDYLEDRTSIVKSKDILTAKSILRTISAHAKIQQKPSLPIPQVQKCGGKKHESYMFNEQGDTPAPKYLDLSEVKAIHDAISVDLEDSQDPVFPKGIKSENMLDSAISRQLTGIGSYKKYQTIQSIAATLVYGIISNHPFHNGNKRCGIVSMLVFLNKNKFIYTGTEDELFKFALDVADHRISEYGRCCVDSEIFAISGWINHRITSISTGERTITKRSLEERLTHFGCTIDPESGYVSRIVNRQMSFLPSRKLTAKMPIKRMINQSSLMDKGIIHSIRKDLELDEMHGHSFEEFYGGITTVSEFVAHYSSLLKRLSLV